MLLGNKRLFSISEVRDDFPILSKTIRNGKRLIYLDNAATTQKPQCVIDSQRHFYESENANIHRGVHALSEIATEKYERSRELVRSFINARSRREVIFTRGATEGINLVAATFGRANVQENDEIVISHLEHHSNIVPWQLLCQEKSAKLRIIPMNENGELLLDEFTKMLTKRTKLVAVTYASNALGTVTPVKEIVQIAHAHGVPVLVDAAQAMLHFRVDVQALDIDFLVFSAHKMCGPTGVGVLYGRESILNTMPPYQSGGDMIRSVTFEKTLFNELPYKFEAGTPNIAGVIGLGVAIEYLTQFDWSTIAMYEKELLTYATEQVKAINGVRIIGTAAEKVGVLSFLIENIHPHDVGTILDEEGIAVRAGHHCAQPVMEHFGIPATTRASFAFYTTKEEIDYLVRGIHKVKEVFHV
ncbi:MAG: cysteine desulfurase [Bacteroidetes bacterium]|nr:cysteine desulfurase [Bacteroidota bacterium]